jgi:hypothetical protein
MNHCLFAPGTPRIRKGTAHPLLARRKICAANTNDRGATPSRCCLSAAIMEALAITIFLSLVLAVFFVTLFGFSQRDSRRGIEQEALLPFDDGPRKPAAEKALPGIKH